MSKKIGQVAAVIAVIIAIIAVTMAFRANAFSSLLSKRAVAEDEIEIESRSMVFWVEATGLLSASVVENFGSPAAVGNYWQFQIVNLVPEGKQIKKGEMLIMFDAQKVMEDLERFQSQLDQANKELEKTRAQIELERRDLESKLAAAENKHEKSKLKQTTTTAIASSNDVEKDRLELEQTTREVRLLKEQIDWHIKSSEATYKIIESTKARAQNKVNEIQRALESFQSKATRDGVVVYKTKWNGEKFKVGESVWMGQSILEIPELSTIIAEAFVPEVDVGKVKTGQRAEVTIDAFPGRAFSGTVKSLGRLVRPKAWDIPNKILEAQIALDNLDTSIMRPNMSVKVKIEINSISDCLAVPLRAVRVTSDGAKVRLKVENGWREQAVKLGESNGTDVIVTEGLNMGDRVAADFSKVKAAQ
jgi:HlyD family secretion protein